MTNPANSAVQNLLPVQAYFDAKDNFITFIGQGKPFYATSNPIQSGLTITNSTLDSSPIGSTSPSTGVFTNIATTTGTISTQPTGANDIVNLLALQSYAAGISWKQPCAVATLAPITLSGLQTIDTYTTLAGDRVLVKNQTNAAFNGIYLASAGAWTRSLDADAWQEFVSAISFIEYGTQAGGAWFCTATPGGTLNVTPLNWSQFTTSATYSAGTGLTLTGSVFSITPVGTASTYGSATQTPVFTTNASGQVTSVTNTTITPALSSITGFGTGVATALAINTGSVGAFVVNGGVLGTPTSGNFSTGTFTWPTFNQNTTGTAAGLSATLAIASGGTGQTTASAAFNALSPITTVGDLIYGSATNTSSRLGIGSSGQILSVVAGIPAWVNAPSSMVYPGAGIPNSTGSAWGTSYTTTGSGTVVALATSPSLTTPILGTPQSGNFSTGTFTWPTFNQNTTGTAAGLSATLAVGSGGTGSTSLAANNVLLGNGTSALQVVAPGTSGNILTSNGTTWVSSAAPATGVTIADDTTSATPYYPLFARVTSGTAATEYTSSTKYSFTPSTGLLTSTAHSVSASALTSSNTSNLAVGGTLGFSDTGIIAHEVASLNGYLQHVIQNTNAGASASAEFIAYNNAGTASTNYACVGINSSAYTGTGSINAAGYGYFLTGSTDLVIGTIGANSIHFTANSSAKDSIVISATGNVTTPNGIWENANTITANYTIGANQNGNSVGPITISTGVSVTVPSGSRWVIQ